MVFVSCLLKVKTSALGLRKGLGSLRLCDLMCRISLHLLALESKISPFGSGLILLPMKRLPSLELSFAGSLLLRLLDNLYAEAYALYLRLHFWRHSRLLFKSYFEKLS
jgi:hypothetical protein